MLIKMALGDARCRGHNKLVLLERYGFSTKRVNISPIKTKTDNMKGLIPLKNEHYFLCFLIFHISKDFDFIMQISRALS